MIKVRHCKKCVGTGQIFLYPFDDIGSDCNVCNGSGHIVEGVE
jgi:DnaJ-class molecular chaperone